MKRIYLYALLFFLAWTRLGFATSGFHRCFAPGSSDSTFRDWNYTPNGVYGHIPLAKVAGRSFVQISRQGAERVNIFKYNPLGVLVNTTHVQIKDGKIYLITESDRFGRNYDSTWFTPVGVDEFWEKRRVNGINPFFPCVAIRVVYKSGLIREIFCMADSTKLGYDADGVSHYVYERYNDPTRFGMIKTETFLGDIDNPVISRIQECHKVVNEIDAQGNLVTKSLFGVHDEPVTDRKGIHKIQMRYDRNDAIAELAIYNSKGDLGSDQVSFARVGYDYKKGLLESETFYSADYQIVQASKIPDSASVIVHHYDDSGQEIEKIFYDDLRVAVNNRFGIHKTVYDYSPSGALQGVAYFDLKLRPVMDTYGIHRYYFQTNDKGLTICKSFFDRNEVPMRDNYNNAYKTKLAYDSWGRVCSESFWATDSIKTFNLAGEHEIRQEYNSDGMIIRQLMLDDNGAPFVNRRGFSEIRLEYDNIGKVADIRLFNKDRAAMVNDMAESVSNYHRIHYNYDYFGRITSVEYYDDGGKGVNAKVRLGAKGEVGCQKVAFIYLKNHLSEEIFYPLSSDAVPVSANCDSSVCLLPSGQQTKLVFSGRLFMPLFEQRTLWSIHGINSSDSLVFSNQLAFVGRDSILIFLSNSRQALVEAGCAELYRIVPINQYYQFDGKALDYYLSSGKLASELTYVKGYLQGDAIYYFINGNIREKGEYQNNQRIGLWDYYFDDGIKNKSIYYTDKGPLLMECYDQMGKQLAVAGNGVYEEYHQFGGSYSKVTGNIKNGLMDGEWKIFNNISTSSPNIIERYESGKFVKGHINSSFGYSTYSDHALCSFGAARDANICDHYGQNLSCSVNQKHSLGDNWQSLTKDYYGELTVGMGDILRSGKYSDYTGWIFVDIRYDSAGVIRGKTVRLYRSDPLLEADIRSMLDKLDNKPTPFIGGKHQPFEKFYVLLVQANEVVIPEQVLATQRGTH